VSEAASAQVISLPVFPELTEAQQQTVIDAVLGFYA
jgi:dTDP-4-amino-4,6-dideoxygalactose transaminase